MSRRSGTDSGGWSARALAVSLVFHATLVTVWVLPWRGAQRPETVNAPVLCIAPAAPILDDFPVQETESVRIVRDEPSEPRLLEVELPPEPVRPAEWAFESDLEQEPFDRGADVLLATWSLKSLVPRAAGPLVADPAAPTQPEAAVAAVANRTEARFVAGKPPAYPLTARQRGQQGSVVLRLSIGADGHVDAVTIEDSSGVAALDEAASQAAWRWRFDPATEDGRAVVASSLHRVTFRLERA